MDSLLRTPFAREEATELAADLAQIVAILFAQYGQEGGRKRSERLTPEERSESARRAALARGEQRRLARLRAAGVEVP